MSQEHDSYLNKLWEMQDDFTERWERFIKALNEIVDCLRDLFERTEKQNVPHGRQQRYTERPMLLQRRRIRQCYYQE